MTPLKDFPTVDVDAQIRALAEVKVGDLVAPISKSRHTLASVWRWGGALWPVTKVTAKRFEGMGYTMEKATARRVGDTGRFENWIYIKAPQEILDAYVERNLAEERDKQERTEYAARPDVIAARIITHASADELIAVMTLEDLQSLAKKVKRQREKTNADYDE